MKIYFTFIINGYSNKHVLSFSLKSGLKPIIIYNAK